MLIEFEFSNFRSFKDKTLLSMIPERISDISYSVLKDKYKNKTIKALCSSVIYGANASGKTNVIYAMAFFQSLMTEGKVVGDGRLPNYILPFMDKECKEMYFRIKFIHKNKLVEYTVSISGLEFMTASAKPVIEKECLTVDEVKFYERRGQQLELFLDGQNISTDDFKSRKIMERLAKNSLVEGELFLTNGFKNLFDKDIFTVISEWAKKQMVIIDTQELDYFSMIADGKYQPLSYGNLSKENVRARNMISRIAKDSGMSANGMFVLNDKENKNTDILYSEIDGKALPSTLFESAGTIKTIPFLAIVIRALIEGHTLIVDELDSSLHPNVVFSIINIFHNNEINKNNAQLVYTTHNPIFQKAKIFRRDEIKFVERNHETKSSRLYKLSDYGTSGNEGVKNSTDIMKNYMSGKYGAIEFVDFSDMISEMLQAAEKNNDDN